MEIYKIKNSDIYSQTYIVDIPYTRERAVAEDNLVEIIRTGAGGGGLFFSYDDLIVLRQTLDRVLYTIEMDRENVEKGSVGDDRDTDGDDTCRYVYTSENVRIDSGPHSFEISLGDDGGPILIEAQAMKIFRDKIVKGIEEWESKGWDNG